MIIDIMLESKRSLIALLCVLLLTGAVGGAYAITESVVSKSTKSTVEATLSEYNNVYSKENDEKFKALLNLPFIDDESKGDIYHTLAKNMYIADEKNEYNYNIGCAAFFYDVSGAEEKFVLLFSEYIGRLYENGGFSECEEVFETTANRVDIMKLNDDGIAVGFCLGYADVEEMLGNTEKAAEKLALAKSIMDKQSEVDILDRAKYDILCVRNSLLMGDIATAKKLFSNYSEYDTLGFAEDDQSYLVNYLLPYYELKAKLMLADEDYLTADKYFNLYIDLCSRCNFRILKLRMYDYFYNSTVQAEPRQSNFSFDYRKLSDELIEYYSRDYCGILLDNLQNVYSVEKVEHNQRLRNIALAETIYFSLFALSILIYIGHIAYLYLQVDGLMHMRNKNLFVRKSLRLSDIRKAYRLAIFDIDNFKHINDTYGHDAGDEVLRIIGKIIRTRIRGRGFCYRYGGEEICIIFKSTDYDECLKIAEEIRTAVETYEWKNGMAITISGGIAKSNNGKSPFTSADNALYTAKRNGKNRIATEEDEPNDITKN